MNKNYIFIFLAVIIVAGIFFYFRNQKSSEENQKIRAEALIKLTELSKKIPQTGLTQMAAAIERYHKKNKKYPARLDELYPEFIPYQKFIEEIEWRYEPQADNFFLSKTVTQRNMQMVASIDKNMTPQIGEGVKVAAVSKSVKTEKVTPVLALKPIETIQPIDPLATVEPEPEALIEQPEVVSMGEGEIGHGIPSDISKKLLVWKDKNGVLGFGNVIYPNTRNLTIYKDGSWLNIKKPESKGPQEGTAVTPLAKPQKGSEVIATDYSKKYLVWKDKKGNIGYGNVQYPPIDRIAFICVNGNWQKVVN